MKRHKGRETTEGKNGMLPISELSGDKVELGSGGQLIPSAALKIPAKEAKAEPTAEQLRTLLSKLFLLSDLQD